MIRVDLILNVNFCLKINCIKWLSLEFYFRTFLMHLEIRFLLFLLDMSWIHDSSETLICKRNSALFMSCFFFIAADSPFEWLTFLDVVTDQRLKTVNKNIYTITCVIPEGLGRYVGILFVFKSCRKRRAYCYQLGRKPDLWLRLRNSWLKNKI